MKPDVLQSGRDALGILDRMVAERPADHFQPMSEAVRKLIEMRNGLIAHHRADGGGKPPEGSLSDLNAMISVAIGAQYPIVGIKRERIEQTRDALRDWINRHESMSA